jgi:PTH1 family peptidyl-tRNA hydrolase
LWAIVGLGNFPKKYQGTRHNVGFMVVEELLSRHSLKFKERDLYRIAEGSVEGENAVLAEPLTYMNLSGNAVYKLIRKSGIVPENLIVIHDDVDMPTGRLKLRLGGSSGGHKGVDSVIERMATMDFIRVKIGVGKDPEMLVEDYVLKKFRRDEKPIIKEAVAFAADAVECILMEGLPTAMNRFNVRQKDEPE